MSLSDAIRRHAMEKSAAKPTNLKFKVKKKESAGSGCKTSSVALQTAAQRGAALAKAAMADPTFAPVAMDMAKTGAMGEVAKNLLLNAGGIVIGAGLVGAANVGMVAVSRAFQSLTEGRDKAQAYAGMLSVHKQLGQEDKNKVQNAFNTLYRFNPEVARDPLSAGSFVQKTIDYGAVTMDEVGKLIKQRKELRDAERSENTFGGQFGLANLQSGNLLSSTD